MQYSTLNIKPGQTIAQALDSLHEHLQQYDVYFGHGTDNAWDESVQLILAAAHLPADSDSKVLEFSLDAQAVAAIVAMAEARVVLQTPLPYLTGKAWFAGLEFRCDQRAIIPRSPLAELILDRFAPWYSGPEPTRILDLCCGGGCIGLAVAHYFPGATVDLVDIDAQALALARENAVLLGLQDRVNIYPSDVFAGIADNTRFDIIVSNPPYVNAPDLAAMPAEYHHEPALALGSGEDGLDLTHRLLAQAGQYLTPEGALFVEMGYSWPALESAYPRVPFTWLEFEHGGEGVFTLSGRQWQHYRESWRG